MQVSQSGRVVHLIAVSQGVVKVANPGDLVWTAVTNNTGATPALNATGTIFSTACNQLLFFADGINAVYYDPVNLTLETWTLTRGEFPEDVDGNLPTLICTWRGRVVQSGLILDPQNIFWSAVGDPFDYAYEGQYLDGVLASTPTMAVAGNLAPFGLIGDVVTSLCPYTDDILVIFGDSTIHMMKGDPADGGQVDLVSDAIGGAFGKCWCKDPMGTIYFCSTQTGIYTLVPGQKPQKISQRIDSLLLDVDTGDNAVRMEWNDRYQGLNVFVTNLDEPQGTPLFYEARTGAWWKDTLPDDMNPLCCCTLDGNEPGDRVVVTGGWDGFVRAIDPTATTDDGHAITSYVWLGPFCTDQMDDVMLRELLGELGAESGDVEWSIHVGETAEEALASEAVETGTWEAGRNPNQHPNWAAHYLYIKLGSTDQWAMEHLRTVIESLGLVRQRG
jgi:hypothetical protein